MFVKRNYNLTAVLKIYNIAENGKKSKMQWFATNFKKKSWDRFMHMDMKRLLFHQQSVNM